MNDGVLGCSLVLIPTPGCLLPALISPPNGPRPCFQGRKRETQRKGQECKDARLSGSKAPGFLPCCHLRRVYSLAPDSLPRRSGTEKPTSTDLAASGITAWSTERDTCLRGRSGVRPGRAFGFLKSRQNSYTIRLVRLKCYLADFSILTELYTMT